MVIWAGITQDLFQPVSTITSGKDIKQQKLQGMPLLKKGSDQPKVGTFCAPLHVVVSISRNKVAETVYSKLH